VTIKLTSVQKYVRFVDLKRYTNNIHNVRCISYTLARVFVSQFLQNIIIIIIILIRTMFMVLTLWLWVHAMNAEQRKTAADLWTKPTDMSH